MEDRKRHKIKDLLVFGDFGSEVLLKGWVRTKRGNKNVVFLALNDGSVIHNIDRKSTRLNSSH